MNKKSAKFSKHEENGTIMKCLRHFSVNNTKKKILREFRVEPKKPKSTWKYNFLLISIGRLFSFHFLSYQAKHFLYELSQAFLGGMGNSYCYTNFSYGTNRCIFINVCGKWIVLSFKYSNI